ncbi:hypothetical protein OUHCRE13_01330 [Enterobacter roggenkampii]
MTARHWRTIIAIRMPIGLRQNSSSSLMGNLSSHAVKIIVIRVTIKKREVKAQELRKVLLEAMYA